MTDFNCDYISWKEGLLHGGFFTCAQWMVENVFSDTIPKYMGVYNTKKVVVCGHSMGAGVCAILGLLLNDLWESSKSTQWHPDDLSFYCYGTPAVISEHLVERSQCHGNIFTFNYGNDLVSHLSFGSIRDFCTLIMVASKYVSRSFFYYLNEDSPVFEEAMNDIQSTDKLLRGNSLSRSRSRSPSSSNQLLPDACNNIKLLSPGIYYQIYKVDELPSTLEFSSPAAGEEYTHLASSICPDKAFKYTLLQRSQGQHHCHMLVTSNSIAHHLPFRYELGFDRSIQTMAAVASSRANA